MHFDHDPVGTHGHAADRERFHEVALAGGVTRVDDDRQVGEVVEERHRRQVHRVTCVGLERADAPLAQDHVRVSRADDVLGRHEQLLDRRHEAAFEHHRPGDSPDGRQQRVVLHVARADLEDVGVLGDDVDLVRLHHLGDHRQAGLLARLLEVAQRFDAQPLEGIRARARLERPTAQDRRALGRDGLRRLEELVAALDRTRPGHHRQRPVADHRVADADHGVLGVELPRRQLERPADRRHRLDPGQRRQATGQDLLLHPDLADDRDDDALRAGMVVRGHAFRQDLALDAEDLRLARADDHHDDHPFRLLVTRAPRASSGQNKRAEAAPLLR